MKILDKGKAGLEVADLQRALEGLGFLPDGVESLAEVDEHGTAVFKEHTEEAVNRLRSTFGWDQHGRATQNTLRAIRVQVATLQRKLAASGFYKGEAHGRFDETTREALKQFQAKHIEKALSVTGRLDNATREVLAGLPPFAFEEVLCSELDAVNRGREEAGQHPEEDAAGSGNAVVRAHQARLLGLAFSGGGIRSATFNLGVLQALARLGLLRHVDYLSTVSGGGYIGSWLHAWVHREDGGIRGVERALAVDSGAMAHEPRQVTWLRQYSNYLTPRIGLLSADTMAGVATWLRNVILNQVILGALGMLVLCAPWLVLMLVHMPWWTEGVWSIAAMFIGAALVVIAAFMGGMENGAIEGGAAFGTSSTDVRNDSPPRSTAGAVIMMAAFAALLLGVAAPFAVLHSPVQGWKAAALLGFVQAIFIVAGWWWGLRKARAQEKAPGSGESPGARVTIRAALFAALAGGAALAALMVVLLSLAGEAVLEQAQGRMLLVVLGPPAVLIALLLGVTVHTGVAGRGLREPSREWWSRTGGILFSVMLGWLTLAGVALLGSYGVFYAGVWVGALGGIVWLATTVAGVVLGRSPTTGAGKGGWKEMLATVAPWVFVAGLLVLLSLALHTAFIGMGGPGRKAVCNPVPDTSIPSLRSAYRINLEVNQGAGTASGEVLRVKPDPGCSLVRYADEADKALAVSPVFLPGLFVSLWLLAILLGRRVDINVFAFHMFYRNRLERCYMGASNPKRRGHPFTGLDPGDSPGLTDLKCDGMVQRPYPLINTALNIAHSSNLAWQERKAASFLFTPEFCGYQLPAGADADVVAYQKTDRYLTPLQAEQETGKPGGKLGWISLGTPITISGAAASPNAGYHTNPATAFLMTVFNVRLGWWIQNTHKIEHWTEPGPRQSISYLLKELLASTTDTDKFVYVSDGGHFENLGIYELVRRRCRYIIACDAGCDPSYTFEDLGNAIRKCQIDLGIEIEIDPGAIVPDPETGRSLFHCAVGTIHYERLDPVATPGYLLYIKASLTGDEPTDVNQYKAAHVVFPYESTGDQWYSESQFESYRKLGHHVAMQVLAQAREDATQRSRADVKKGLTSRELPYDQELFFHALSEKWYPPSRAGQDAFSKHGKELGMIFDRMRQDGNLHFLDAQIYPEWVRLSSSSTPGPLPAMRTVFPCTQDELRAGFYLCNTLIQLMENVYVDLQLEEEHAHPDNRGWMNLFHHWSWAGMFRVTWAVCVATYGARFQQFCRRHLGLESGLLTLADPVNVGDPQWEDSLNFVEQEQVRRIIVGHYAVLAKGAEVADAAAAAETLEDMDKDLLVERSNEWMAIKGHKRLVVQPLEMRVSDPFGKEQDFIFPVGFALLGEPDSKGVRSLVYFRIQDHLRRMGLGRSGLQKLRGAYGDMRIDMPAGLDMIIGEADPALLQHLWHSVLWAAPLVKEVKRV